VVASRAARSQPPERLLATGLTAVILGLPLLLLAGGAAPAVAGIMIAGAGIGALFPLTSSLHVRASGRTADTALGEILAVAALGQICGPLAAGAIAQASSLRAGLLVLPAATLLAAAGLSVHGERRARRSVAKLRPTRRRAVDT